MAREEVKMPSSVVQSLQRARDENRAKISHAQYRIRVLEGEMRSLSGRLNAIIQDGLAAQTSVTPEMLPLELAQQLGRLQVQKLQICAQISWTRVKVQGLKQGEDSEIVQQIRLKQGLLAESSKILAGLARERQLLQGSLLYNKQQLEVLENSDCIMQVQEHQRQLQNMDRTAKELGRQTKTMDQSEVLMGIYSQFVHRRLSASQDNSRSSGLFHEGQLQGLLQEIRHLCWQRNNREQQYAAARQKLAAQVEALQQINAQLQRQLRLQPGGKFRSREPINFVHLNRPEQNRALQESRSQIKQSYSLPNLRSNLRRQLLMNPQAQYANNQVKGAMETIQTQQNSRALIQGPESSHKRTLSQTNRKLIHKQLVDYRLTGSLGKTKS